MNIALSQLYLSIAHVYIVAIVLFRCHALCMEWKSDDLRQILARNVRMARADLRLSQEELANRCGLHRNYVGAIERGECNITLVTLTKIASGLDLTPDILLVDLRRKDQM